MKIRYLLLFLFVAGCFLIGCNGGGSNPIAADMQTPVTNGETFVMQLPPLASIIESMSANTAADADNDPVSAKVEWTGFSAGSVTMKSTRRN